MRLSSNGQATHSRKRGTTMDWAAGALIQDPEVKWALSPLFIHEEAEARKGSTFPTWCSGVQTCISPTLKRHLLSKSRQPPDVYILGVGGPCVGGPRSLTLALQ